MNLEEKEKQLVIWESAFPTTSLRMATKVPMHLGSLLIYSSDRGFLFFTMRRPIMLPMVTIDAIIPPIMNPPPTDSSIVRVNPSQPILNSHTTPVNPVKMTGERSTITMISFKVTGLTMPVFRSSTESLGNSFRQMKNDTITPPTRTAEVANCSASNALSPPIQP